jgi:hypothetical protein
MAVLNVRDKRRNVSIFFGEKLNLGQGLTVLVPRRWRIARGGGGGGLTQDQKVKKFKTN